MRGIDFSSWQSLTMTLLGLALFALIGVGIRLILMMTLQQRRERTNRQINERLKVLIAAYKTLGGSFTGNLLVDPRHLKDILTPQETNEEYPADETDPPHERPRRIRDAVEAALSDILLLGTEEQVRLAQRAAQDLAAGEPVRTHELVISLRNFIREALDLDPVPADLQIPLQGPARPASGSSRNNKANASKGNGMKGGGGGGAGAAGGTSGGMGLGGHSPENPEHPL